MFCDMSPKNRAAHPRRTFALPAAEWLAFRRRHTSAQARLQELVRMDNAGLIPESRTALESDLQGRSTQDNNAPSRG